MWSLGLCLGLGLCVLSPLSAQAAPPESFARAGDLVSAEELAGPWKWSQQSVVVSHAELREVAPQMPERTSVLAFRLKYLTTNLKGDLVEASGLVRLRSDLLDSEHAIPVISYQHSTRVERSDAPSTNVADPEGLGGVLHFASRGYLWAMPDYLGLGSNRDPQAYLHAHGQAVVCADFLKAVRNWASEQNIKLRSDVVLMGYSQGGHSTLALQRYLESSANKTGFKVKVAIPMAGPYSVAGLGLISALQAKSSSQFLFVALALYGLSEDPGLDVDLDRIVNKKYRELLPELLSGKISFLEAAAALPKDAATFFTKEFLTAVTMQGPLHPAVMALQKQDVVDFAAKAPIYLIHSTADDVVPYANSLVAESYLKARNNRVTLVPLEDGHGHTEAARHAFLRALKILQGLSR